MYKGVFVVNPIEDPPAVAPGIWMTRSMLNDSSNAEVEIVNTPLHNAIINENLADLDSLLEQPHTKVNVRNLEGTTPLLLSMELERPASFTLRLLKAGADVNIPGEFGFALTMALDLNQTEAVLECLERGADVNATFEECTALECSVNKGDVEAVCLLLSYGADVYNCKENDNSLLLEAIHRGHTEIAKILVDYYVDCSFTNICDILAMINVTYVERSLDDAFASITANDGTVNSLNSYAGEYAQLFKLIWCKLDWKIYEPSILLVFLEFCNLPAKEWLDCLYFVLESPAAYHLVSQYYRGDNGNFDRSLFFQLLHNFKYRKITAADRITIIWLCLCLGAEVKLSDINIAYKFYGFNEEFEALVSCFSSCIGGVREPLRNLHLPMPTCIVELEDYSDNGFKTILKLLKLQNQYYRNQRLYAGLDMNITVVNPSEVKEILSFFSVPYNSKQKLKQLLQDYLKPGSELTAVVDIMSRVPSLMELSRNKARTYIRDECNVKYPYQFHDAVRRLKIPPLIKDVLLLKRPVY